VNKISFLVGCWFLISGNHWDNMFWVAAGLMVVGFLIARWLVKIV